MGQTGAELEADSVFRDARRRIALVFRMNLVIASVITVILAGAITGTVILGFLGRDVWATTLGGVALLDLIGAAIYRPLAQINRALVRSQQVDMIVLSARQRLHLAEEIPTADKRLAAVRAAWTSIMAELEALSKS